VFLKPVVIANIDERPLTFAEELAKKRKKDTTFVSSYIDLKWIEPTSNRCERLNSIAKLLNDPLRRSQHPKTLEDLLLLKFNPKLWEINTVAFYFRDKKNVEKAEKELLEEGNEEDFGSDDDSD
jgi:hypothetical protein